MEFITDQSAGYLANHLARLFARQLQGRIKPLGLTTGTFPALLVLWEGDGLTQRELIDRLDIEQPTLANTLARMERDGLIVRKKDAADARAQRIWLTDQARALRAPAIAAAVQVNNDALAVLTEAGRDQFIALMRRVIAGMQEPAIDDAEDRREAG
ncbi:MarR family winged helix-turn-helix transcriptional regulator [Thiocystis violascens]|uniref:Transcriptional regulator n=1 Tax=Thiocystis violascens (strain ATCC 17096 / DSM 198 / 6111) TaxID=765911 RepID=I3Y9F8_THIV6|nr:MarR family winged helix-turn-helix transcriptional regulator [Thiocystis violascens]AFL73626.1 transcriptional regulator [Thiocystis violascens DSM 198]